MRLAQLQDVARLGDVLRGRSPVDVAAGVALAEPVELPDERHQAVPGDAQPLGDALEVEQLEVRLALDLRCGRLGNHPDLRLRPGQRRLDVKPGLPARLLREQRPDAGVADAQRGRSFFAHGVLLGRAAMLGDGPERFRPIPSWLSNVFTMSPNHEPVYTQEGVSSETGGGGTAGTAGAGAFGSTRPSERLQGGSPRTGGCGCGLGGEGHCRGGSGAAELAVEEFAAEEDDGGAAVGAGDAEVAGFEVADEGGHFVECQGTSGLDGGAAGEGPAEAVGGGEALEVGGLGFGDDFAEVGGGVDAAEGRGDGAEQPGGGAEGSDVEAEALEIVGVGGDPVAFLGAEFDAGWIEELLGGGVGGVAEALEEDAFVGGVLVDEIEAAGPGGDDVGAVDLAERTHDGGAEAGGGLCMVVGWDVGGRSAACAQVATLGRRACLPAGAVGREEELVDDWAVEAGGGDFGGGGEGAADGGGEAAEDFAGAAEADLGLGGVDVDVDFLGREWSGSARSRGSGRWA